MPSVIAALDGSPRIRRVDPTTEVVTAYPRSMYSADRGIALAGEIDEVVRRYGLRTYDLMLFDPTVAGALRLLWAAILGEGIQISPAVQAGTGEVVTDPVRAAEIALAAEIAEAARRSLDRLDRPIDETLIQLLDAQRVGVALAETTYEYAEDGPDAGRLVLRSLTPKPRSAWRFLVDDRMNAVGIRARGRDGTIDVERWKFAIFSWMPRDNDPRGTSILAAAYNAWNLKAQAFPNYGDFLYHFGDPSYAITAGSDALSYTETAADGTTRTVSPQQQIADQAANMGRAKVVGLPPGSQVTVLESKGEGGAYGAGFTIFDREILKAILFSPRPMQESQHGSKADTESGLDLFNLAVQQGRGPLARTVQDDVLYWFVRFNWGKPAADRLTPRVSFGIQDRVIPEMITALADAFDKGLFEPSQRPWVWDRVGAPAPTEDDEDEDEESEPASASASASQEEGRST